MSNALFPRLPGQTLKVGKKPTGGSTIIQTSTSGKETRISLWSIPTWDFTVSYDHIRQREPYQYIGQVPVAAALAGSTLISDDLKALAGFFLARQGSFDSWLFDDPTDDFIAQQQLGNGNGSLTTFQISRPFGEFSEPIQNINPNSAPVLAGAWSPNMAVLPNSIIIPSVTSIISQSGLIMGGWQIAGWPNYYTCTTQGNTGATEPNWRSAPMPTMTVNDGSVVWTYGGVATVVYLEQAAAQWQASHVYPIGAAITPSSGNPGGFSYVAVIAGTSNSSSPIWSQTYGERIFDTGLTWQNVGVCPAGVLGPRVPQPTSLYSIAQIGSVTPGMITFTTAPPSNSLVFVTSSFYFRCRFKQDVANFQQFLNQIWQLGTLEFVSLKL